MTVAKKSRPQKQQRGQFMTPSSLTASIVDCLELSRETKVLEPSFGDGAFILPLIRRFIQLYSGTGRHRLKQVLQNNIYGVEIDAVLYDRCLSQIESEFGSLPERHNLVRGDFFRQQFQGEWRFDSAIGMLTDQMLLDAIIGNPPFGGTFDPAMEDELDKTLGVRGGLKVKKETYAFFIVKCVELLKAQGHLSFICSDTILTIPTMKGLRTFLMDEGSVSVSALSEFSQDTAYSMIVLDFRRSGRSDVVIRDEASIPRPTIELTGNHSWGMAPSLAPLFGGRTVGDLMIGTSGMTIGKNILFVRKVQDGRIDEPYWFELVEEAITLEGEHQRARLGKLSPRQEAEIVKLEFEGRTRRTIRTHWYDTPLRVELPHPDYKPYNKSNRQLIYTEPDHVIYWKDEGEAVLTFKKSGNWYLRGVGGQPYFGREGLTWSLISSRFRTRYLPPGYILDSGAPCGFLRPNVDQDELFFVLAWTLSPLCTEILKSVINHTMNIQSKDFERLPYPCWVGPIPKDKAIREMKDLISRAKGGQKFDFDSPEVVELGRLFELPSTLQQSTLI